jgi:hypothetical protein
MSKVCLGYFDKDGNHIGAELDNPRRRKYFVIMGTLRNKIAEHEGQSPYRNNRRIESWTKSYCDQRRIFLEILVYINGKLNRTIRHVGWHWQREDRDFYELLKKMMQYVHSHKRSIMTKYNITDQQYIYYPGYFYFN